MKIRKIKKQNKKKMQLLLDQIQKTFNIKNIQYMNGYYDNKPSARCFFEFKQIPKWEFSIWLNDLENNFLGEHSHLIDKFKPSRTYVDCLNIQDFIEKVKQIKEHPKFSFVDSFTFGGAYESALEENMTLDQFVEKEYQLYWDQFKANRKQELEEYNDIKKFIFQLENQYECKLIFTKGFSSNNYNIVFQAQKDCSTYEEENELYQKINTLIFNKNKEYKIIHVQLL